jgi:hypothetical protein
VTSLRIELQASSSPAYRACIQEGVGLIGFRVVKRAKTTLAVLSLRSRHRLVEAAKFISLATRLRKKQLFVNGREQDWSELLEVVSCYEVKVSDQPVHAFCHGVHDGANNLLGCQKLAGWEFGRYGVWRRGRWYFDKDRIKALIRTELGAAQLCPNIDLARIDSIIESLPESVNPETDAGWCFYKTSSRPGDVVHRAQIRRPNCIEIIRFSGVGPSAHSIMHIEALNETLQRPIPLEVAEWVVMKGSITDVPIAT